MFIKFVLWLILLVICWPLAILGLILYPIVWLLLLPFRLVGITVGAVFDLIQGHHHPSGQDPERAGKIRVRV